MQKLVEVGGGLSLFEGEVLGDDGVEGVLLDFITGEVELDDLYVFLGEVDGVEGSFGSK